VVTLRKATPKVWDGLFIEGLTREEIARRRAEDVEELERQTKERYEIQKTTRHGSLL
jgi:hypothetical protein